MATNITTLEDIVAKLGAAMVRTEEEWSKSRIETERSIAESRAETKRILAESQAETGRILADGRIETERILADGRIETERILAESRAKAEQSRRETERIVAESRTETERILAESRAETERTMNDLSKKVARMADRVGGLGNRLGEIIELIVIPGVKEKMNALNYNFTMVTTRKEYSKKDSEDRLTEVDLLLENSHVVMAIEVKTRVDVDRVEHHLSRLKLLRDNADITGMAGKTMYAGIAGITIDDDARDFAIAKGMYLIEIQEDDDRVNIVSPEEAKVW
jgi:hypothetical protein